MFFTANGVGGKKIGVGGKIQGKVFILTFMPCKIIIASIKVNEKKGNYCGSN